MLQLSIASLREAEHCLATRPLAHVLSIGSPHQPWPRGLREHPARRLRLEFDDLRSAAAGPPAAVPPHLEDLERIVDFARAIRPDELILVHCSMGFSRSPAAALVVLATALGPGRERDAVAALYRIKPLIFPNPLVVELGDAALERHGALVAALCGRPHGSRP